MERNTLNGRVELVVKLKRLDIETIKQNYAICDAWTIFKNCFNVLIGTKSLITAKKDSKTLSILLVFPFSHLIKSREKFYYLSNKGF